MDEIFELYEPNNDMSFGRVFDDLRMMQLIKTEDKDGIHMYTTSGFDAEKPTLASWKMKAKNALSRSPLVASIFNRDIKSEPRAYVDTLTAVPDRTDRVYIDNLLGILIPELGAVSKHERYSDENVRERFSESNEGNYFENEESTKLFGSDPNAGLDKELFRSKDNSGELYATGMYFGYSSKKGEFTKIPIAYNEKISGKSSEITAEIPLSTKIPKEVTLPRRIGAKIITERVKVVYENGREDKVEVKKNQYGEDTVLISWRPGMKSLLYSQEVEDVPFVPDDVSAEDYLKQTAEVKKTGKESGIDEPILKLFPQDEYFVKSLEGQSPKEKLYAIEKYVQDVSYYDFKNSEVMQDKYNLSPDERLSFMEIRCREIGKTNEVLKRSGKRYAGVCADFALLTTALMRKAGLMAGIAKGAVVEDGVATIASAHSLSVALWPSTEGNRAVPIDGTPTSGITEEETNKLSRIRFATLKEREDRVLEVEKEDAGQSLAMIEEIERRLGGGEKGVIEQIQNGELERMLNAVLKYEVKKSHENVITRLLEASRYGGVPVFSDNLEDRLKVEQFLENEIKNERGKSMYDENSSSGTELFGTFREYIDRYEKESQDRSEAIKKVERVIHLTEQYLNKTEKRALLLLIQYLKAEKMNRKETIKI